MTSTYLKPPPPLVDIGCGDGGDGGCVDGREDEHVPGADRGSSRLERCFVGGVDGVYDGTNRRREERRRLLQGALRPAEEDHPGSAGIGE